MGNEYDVQSACNRVTYVEKAKFIYNIYIYSHTIYTYNTLGFIFSSYYFHFGSVSLANNAQQTNIWSRVDDKEMIKINTIDMWRRRRRKQKLMMKKKNQTLCVSVFNKNTFQNIAHSRIRWTCAEHKQRKHNAISFFLDCCCCCLCMWVHIFVEYLY